MIMVDSSPWKLSMVATLTALSRLIIWGLQPAKAGGHQICNCLHSTRTSKDTPAFQQVCLCGLVIVWLSVHVFQHAILAF